MNYKFCHPTNQQILKKPEKNDNVFEDFAKWDEITTIMLPPGTPRTPEEIAKRLIKDLKKITNNK